MAAAGALTPGIWAHALAWERPLSVMVGAGSTSQIARKAAESALARITSIAIDFEVLELNGEHMLPHRIGWWVCNTDGWREPWFPREEHITRTGSQGTGMWEMAPARILKGIAQLLGRCRGLREFAFNDPFDVIIDDGTRRLTPSAHTARAELNSVLLLLPALESFKLRFSGSLFGVADVLALLSSASLHVLELGYEAMGGEAGFCAIIGAVSTRLTALRQLRIDFGDTLPRSAVELLLSVLRSGRHTLVELSISTDICGHPLGHASGSWRNCESCIRMLEELRDAARDAASVEVEDMSKSVHLAVGWCFTLRWRRPLGSITPGTGPLSHELARSVPPQLSG